MKIGLVLSGGGVRAVAHIGLLKAMSEYGLKPNQISGTSGGALVAALYAHGYSPEEMLLFFKKTPLFKVSLITFRKPGLINSEKYQKIFDPYFKKKNFEDLIVPITITATNLLNGKVTYFNSGPYLKPLIASCALPPYFSPIEIEDSIYTDGGIANNFPVEPLLNQKKFLIGSFVNPIQNVDKKSMKSTLKFLYRVYHLSMDMHYYKKFGLCEFMFLPKGINQIGVLDSRMINKSFQLGYNEALRYMPTLIQKINQYQWYE